MTRSAFVRLSAGTLAIYQGPLDQLDYGLDYSALLKGDPIVSSAWEADGDITVDRFAVHDGAVASAFISGSQGTVTNTVTSAGGRRKAVSFCVVPPPVGSCA